MGRNRFRRRGSSLRVFVDGGNAGRVTAGTSRPGVET